MKEGRHRRQKIIGFKTRWKEFAENALSGDAARTGDFT